MDSITPELKLAWSVEDTMTDVGREANGAHASVLAFEASIAEMGASAARRLLMRKAFGHILTIRHMLDELETRIVRDEWGDPNDPDDSE